MASAAARFIAVGYVCVCSSSLCLVVVVWKGSAKLSYFVYKESLLRATCALDGDCSRIPRGANQVHNKWIGV